MTKYLLLLVLYSHLAFPQQAKEKDISKSIGDYMNLAITHDYFSGTILIAKDGKVLFQKGYGKASLELNVPNTVNTTYSIASLTKQFTSLAIMQLVERNKLKLTDPFCFYVADCPDAWKTITIHQLLTHTSGIMNFSRLPDWDEKHKLQPYTIPDVINLVRDKPLQFSPGEKFNYSNTNYQLLGLVIEKVSGLSFSDFIRINILNKIRMKHTGCYSSIDIVPNLASGYYHKVNIAVPAPYENLELGYAAGFMYSTVTDLLLWDQALYSDELLSKRSLDILFTPFKENYGLGWEVKEKFNRKMVGHAGSNNGFSAYLMRYPEDKITVIVLSNSDKTNATKIAYDISAILFNQPYSPPTKDAFDSLAVEYHKSGINGVVELCKTPQIKHAHDLVELLGEFGYDLLDLKRADDAIKIFDLLLKENPKSSYAHDFLGDAYFFKGEYKTAKTYFEKAIALDADNDYAIKGLKKTNEKLGL